MNKMRFIVQPHIARSFSLFLLNENTGEMVAAYQDNIFNENVAVEKVKELCEIKSLAENYMIVIAESPKAIQSKTYKAFKADKFFKNVEIIIAEEV